MVAMISLLAMCWFTVWVQADQDTCRKALNKLSTLATRADKQKTTQLGPDDAQTASDAVYQLTGAMAAMREAWVQEPVFQLQQLAQQPGINQPRLLLLELLVMLAPAMLARAEALQQAADASTDQGRLAALAAAAAACGQPGALPQQVADCCTEYAGELFVQVS